MARQQSHIEFLDVIKHYTLHYLEDFVSTRILLEIKGETASMEKISQENINTKPKRQ